MRLRFSHLQSSRQYSGSQYRYIQEESMSQWSEFERVYELANSRTKEIVLEWLNIAIFQLFTTWQSSLLGERQLMTSFPNVFLWVIVSDRVRLEHVNFTRNAVIHFSKKPSPEKWPRSVETRKKSVPLEVCSKPSWKSRGEQKAENEHQAHRELLPSDWFLIPNWRIGCNVDVNVVKWASRGGCIGTSVSLRVHWFFIIQQFNFITFNFPTKPLFSSQFSLMWSKLIHSNE